MVVSIATESVSAQSVDNVDDHVGSSLSLSLVVQGMYYFAGCPRRRGEPKMTDRSDCPRRVSVVWRRLDRETNETAFGS
jgi:hypothetical protein